MNQHTHTKFVAAAMMIAAAVGEAQGARPVDVTLDESVARALASHPAVEAAVHGVSAAEARALQAGLWPNPGLEIEVENFGGDRDLHGFQSAEMTALVSQSLPLGGKPGRRRAVADAEHAVAGRDLESIRLDIVEQVTVTFSMVLAAQQREDLAVKLLEVAEDFSRIVRAKVDAGKVSPVESTRAQIEVAQAQVRRARAARELRAARTRLAATWGSPIADFESAVGDLPRPEFPPPFEDLRPMLAATPDIGRLDDLVERQRRVVAFEKSLRIPDLAIGVGPRRFEATGQSAWVAGVGLSIPIFDRNQGARKASEFDLARMRRDAATVRLAVETELAVVCERLNAAVEAAHSAEREVMPSATSALAAVETGYREGKFGFIDVIAAQRAYFEASTLLLDSLEEYAVARADLDRLIGRPLDASGGPTTGNRESDGDER
jgi:cobalt-zinc-cadmium efflux system outer membrane protein